MCLYELCIYNSAFPAYCCCQKLQSCCCKALLISHHSPTKPGFSDLSCHFCLFTAFCSLSRFSSVAQQNSVPGLVQLSHFILYLFHGFIPFFPALSLVFLSLMHFLCHSVLQASHVKSPAFPQIPSSLLVSSSTVSFSCCPRNCIFPKLDSKLFKAWL